MDCIGEDNTDLLDIISSLWKSLIDGDSSSSSKEGCGGTATVTVERDTRTERKKANVETGAAVKELAEETELADETADEEADAESHADGEDTHDGTEVAADAIKKAELEDETVGPEPESKSEVGVEVKVGGEPEAEGEPELEGEDEKSDGAEVEDEESDDETADDADAPAVNRIRGIGPAYAKRFSGIGIRTTADLVAADAGEVGDEIDVSPKHVQRWIGRAGDA